jgi:hypothetical protein
MRRSFAPEGGDGGGSKEQGIDFIHHYLFFIRFKNDSQLLRQPRDHQRKITPCDRCSNQAKNSERASSNPNF